MRNKRTSLDALDLQSEQSVEAELQPPKSTKPTIPKTVQQTAYLTVAVHEQLRRLAFEERSKMHDYIMEGLDLVFQKHGPPAIDELKKMP